MWIIMCEVRTMQRMAFDLSEIYSPAINVAVWNVVLECLHEKKKSHIPVYISVRPDSFILYVVT